MAARPLIYREALIKTAEVGSGGDLPAPSIAAFARALALSVQEGNEGLTASALMGMAGARQKNKEGRVATACMRRALALVPEDAAGWRNASDLVRKEDEGERSLGFARRALAIDRNDPTAHSNLGLAAAAIGDLSGARAAFRRAISLDPADPRHYCNLADPLHLAGRFDAMRFVLRRALALTPDFAVAAYMLGVTGMLTGELESAWRHYEHRFAPPAVVKARPFP